MSLWRHRGTIDITSEDILDSRVHDESESPMDILNLPDEVVTTISFAKTRVSFTHYFRSVLLSTAAPSRN